MKSVIDFKIKETKEQEINQFPNIRKLNNPLNL